MSRILPRFHSRFFLSPFLFLLFTVSLAGCVSEKYLTTRDGVRIAYDYQKADPEKGTVLLVHGLGASLDEWYSFRKFLNENEWSTFALDLRGHGFSTQWRADEVDWRNLTAEGRLSSLKDLEAATKYLGSRDHLWIVGSSFGANLGLLFASREPSVEGVVLLAPGYSHGGIFAEPAMEDYGARPVLLIAAEDDPGAPKTCEVLQQRAAGPKKMLIYKTGGHASALLESVKELPEEILAWMNQNRVN